MSFMEDVLIDAPDGCVWTIRWLHDIAAWWADAYQDDDTPEVGPCTCHRPLDGVYDTLTTIERAMGFAIPDDARVTLERNAAEFPMHDDDKASWGHGIGYEITRVDENGTFWESFAPTWAEDPTSPEWKPE